MICRRRRLVANSPDADPQYVIESLSDSTIYMAYYTVAHLLQVRFASSLLLLFR
jgi:leucyl-tRNA synthetase